MGFNCAADAVGKLFGVNKSNPRSRQSDRNEAFRRYAEIVSLIYVVGVLFALAVWQIVSGSSLIASALFVVGVSLAFRYN